ncbi:DsbA family protein [Halorussus lipolyticus]|uniref:DsbA family protein n=1 Tax=Halorussus lipolyticus TaxID=3034024 RepID=UPI0023E77C32|nr:thioredoxin domain-containing protein [Halorussus sp. DT80]
MTKQTTRRALLAGTTAALSGLAGCSSITGSESPTDSNPTTAGSESAMGDSAMHPADGETGFGIDLSGNPVMGPSDAPVDVYYWTDFQCPFCKRFEQNTLPKLVENDVTDEKVRFTFLELPNIGEASRPAARMAKCVWRQVRESDPGAYLDWHTAVFDAQEKPNSGWAKTDNLLDITRNVGGVDADSVQSCLQSDRSWAESAVEDDVKAAQQSGITATPAFVLYNSDSDKAGKIVGAQPYDRFETAIEKVEDA